MYQGRVLKKNVTTHRPNPYTLLIIEGDGERVRRFLGLTFVGRGQVAVGHISEHVKLAGQVPGQSRMSEQSVRAGFQELAENGYLTIDGNEFTPGESLLNDVDGDLVEDIK